MSAESAEFARSSELGLEYEALMGRWSRAMAHRFVPWLAAHPGQRWLDLGCGTGALTSTILTQAAPSEVWGVDPKPEYIRQARHQYPDRRCLFLVGHAHRLPKEIENVDLTVSALMLNLIDDPPGALGEMVRVTRAGGRVATYLWDFARGLQLARYFWDSAIALDRAAEPLDQGRRYPLCHPDKLRALFAGAGLASVELQAFTMPMVFESFDDYWVPIATGHGRMSEYLATLAPVHQHRLRERLRAALPTRPDGSIPLTALAWAIVGERGA